MWHASGMRYALGLAMVAAIAMLGEGIFAQGGADPNAAPNPYRVDEGWAKLPQGRKWGAAIGIDMDRDGKSIWVFDRCATANDCSESNLAPIQKFDASGNVVFSFGAGMFNYPHGLFIDRIGDPNARRESLVKGWCEERSRLQKFQRPWSSAGAGVRQGQVQTGLPAVDFTHHGGNLVAEPEGHCKLAVQFEDIFHVPCVILVAHTP